jgi:hypothetical protein
MVIRVRTISLPPDVLESYIVKNGKTLSTNQTYLMLCIDQTPCLKYFQNQHFHYWYVSMAFPWACTVRRMIVVLCSGWSAKCNGSTYKSERQKGYH